MIRKSRLIRFVENFEHLVDDLQNGFQMKPHKVSFETTIDYILPSLIRFLIATKASNHFINKIKQLAKMKGDSVLNLRRELIADSDFKSHYSAYLGGDTFDVPMKSFTELRDNQKIHPYHTALFGKYGIALTMEWGLKNNADRVIYIKKGSEVSKRLGLIFSMLRSIAFNGESINAMLNLLSFVEIGDNSNEYEWRIVGQHRIIQGSKTPPPPILNFTIQDILAIYVTNKEEIEKIIPILKEKKRIEKFEGEIPQVVLIENAILSTQDIEEIEKIHLRRE